MIVNPSQYQLDRAIENEDLIIVAKPNLSAKLIDFLIRKLTNQDIFEIKYKDKMIDNRLITIYSKEETHSSVEKNLLLKVYQRKDPRIHSEKPVKLMGNINYIMIENGKEGVQVSYEVIKNMIDEIDRSYKDLVRNSDMINYIETKHSIIKEYTHNHYTYEFLNGFQLDIATCKNTKNNKYVIMESTFGIQTDESDSEEKAFNQLGDLLEIRIDLALNNKLLHFKDICKREKIGEDTSLEI